LVLHEIIPSSRAIRAHCISICGVRSALRSDVARIDHPGSYVISVAAVAQQPGFASGMPAFSLRVMRGNLDDRKRNAALGGGSIFRTVMQALRNRRDGSGESVRKSQA
jgi:hypothetical protein